MTDKEERDVERESRRLERLRLIVLTTPDHDQADEELEPDPKEAA
jgi:hypothetical protein